MVSARSWRSWWRDTPIATTAIWCTTTITLVLVVSCTSFSSAASRDATESEPLHERFIVIEENVALKVDVAVPLLQDLRNDAPTESSSSTHKSNTEDMEQQSITTQFKLKKVADHHGPGAAHPKPSSDNSYSSFKKEAQLTTNFMHRKSWQRPSHDHLQQPGAGPHIITANQKNYMFQETVTTTSNLLLEFLNEIWKSTIQVMVREYHKRLSKLSPAATAAATVAAQRQTRLVRVSRRKLLLKAESNSSTKFSHSAKSSSSNFYDDYKDPESHPPKSN